MAKLIKPQTSYLNKILKWYQMQDHGNSILNIQKENLFPIKNNCKQKIKNVKINT